MDICEEDLDAGTAREDLRRTSSESYYAYHAPNPNDTPSAYDAPSAYDTPSAYDEPSAYDAPYKYDAPNAPQVSHNTNVQAGLNI